MIAQKELHEQQCSMHVQPELQDLEAPEGKACGKQM